MADGRLFITTPVGNIGSRVVSRLTDEGANFSVLALAEDADRLPDSVREAADVHVGSMDDLSAMTQASRGADGMLFILPFIVTADDLAGLWRKFTAVAQETIRSNEISHVVFVSSQGASPDNGNLMAPLFEFETALAEVVPNLRVLRCGTFMENFLPIAAPISQGAMPVAVPPSVPLQLVATSDIGDVAAGLLTDLTWSGQENLTVYGPEDLTPVQMAGVLSDLLGRDVQHVPITSEQFTGALVEAGCSNDVARSTAELYAKLADSDFEPDARSAAGTTSTSFEQFARETLLPAAGVRPIAPDAE